MIRSIRVGHRLTRTLCKKVGPPGANKAVQMRSLAVESKGGTILMLVLCDKANALSRWSTGKISSGSHAVHEGIHCSRARAPGTLYGMVLSP